MKTLKKVGVAFGILATIGCTALFASNTNNATQGTIKTDADKYLDVNYFNEVNFDKMFLDTNLSDFGFQLGGATKVNDFYFAGRYAGNFWGGLKGSSTKTTDLNSSSSSTNTNNQNYVNTDKNYHNQEQGKWVNGNKHDLSLLFGLKNMGFTLDSTLIFNNNSNVSSNPSENNSSNELGSSSTVVKPNINNACNNKYTFDLGWGGMTLNAKKAIAKPFVNLILDFRHHNTYTKTETAYKEFNKAQNKDIINGVQTVETKSNADNLFNLGIKLGSDFVWGKDSPFMQILTVQNYMKFDITPSEYESTKTTTVDNINNKTTTTSSSRRRLEKNYFYDSIFASYRANYKPTEKLTLGLKANLNTSFTYTTPGKVENTNTIADGTTIKTLSYADGNPVVEGVNTSSSTFVTSIDPYFSLGLSYAVKPNFALNLGYFGNLPITTITNKVTKTSTKVGDNSSTYEVKTSNVTTNDYWNRMSAGFKWDITNNCALDVALGIDNIQSPSFKKIWEAGWNLGFTFKK